MLKPRLACLGKFYEARGSGHKTRVAGSFLGRVFRCSRFANDHLRFVMLLNPGLKRQDIGTDRGIVENEHTDRKRGSLWSPIPLIFARELYPTRSLGPVGHERPGKAALLVVAFRLNGVF